MTKGTCIYVPLNQYVEGKGYVPSVVTEGEAGHSPLVGKGAFSEPWYWGHDHDKAQKIADDYNRGCALTAAEARERARIRRERALDSAAYWDAYAAEVESWEAAR